MPNLAKPFFALILGIVPFFLFIGTTSITTSNGEIIAESRLNFGGILLALIGAGLAWSVLSERRPGPAGRKPLAVLAALICALQLVSASGLWRIDPLDWLMPDRNLPALQYTGLSGDDRIVLLPESEENYRSTLAHNKAQIIRDARLHNTYAALCHGGRSRIDLARAEAQPEIFDTDLLARVTAGTDRMQANAPGACSERQSIRIMVTMADENNRRMDLFDRLAGEYHSFMQASRAP